MVSAFFFLYLLAGSQAFIENPGPLSWAISLDLIMTLPLIWFLTIRKQAISKVTVYTAGLIGLALTFVLLPPGQRELSEWLLAWVVPLIEGAIFLYMAWNLRKLIAIYKRTEGEDFMVKMRKSLAELSGKPKLAGWLAGEIAIPYYLFFAGRVRKDANFTYHKKSSLAMLSWVIALLIVVETLALHFLIALWSEPLAWVLSISNVYIFALLAANYRASLHRQIRLDDDELILYAGLFAEGRIPLHKIAGAQKGGFAPSGEEESLNIAFFGYQNVRIDLKEVHSLRVFPGRERDIRKLYLHVDQRDAFIDAINDKISRL